VDRSLRVLEHRVPVRIGDELACVSDLVGREAAFEILLGAIEQGGRDRGVAFLRKPVTDSANVMIDAKYLLNDHDAALGRTRGIGAISAQVVAVAGGEREVLTQVFLLSNKARPVYAARLSIARFHVSAQTNAMVSE